MKKYIVFFLSFVVFIAPIANAGFVTNTGKYIINTVKKLPNATRVEATNTVTGAKHVINHGVSSSALASGIAAGVIQFGVSGGLSLAFEAITGLGIAAVDWVLDPANNSVKYAPKGTTGTKYIAGGRGYYYDSPEEACREYFIANGGIKKMEGQCFGLTQFGFPTGDIPIKAIPPDSKNWKSVTYDALADKTIDLAKQGKAPAKKTIEDYVTHIAQKGDLDDELDASTDITKQDKQCSAGYEKVGEVCIKKPDPSKDKQCPADTVKVGDKCIKKPDKDDSNCGECCDAIIDILGSMAAMNAQFYANSLDNDAQMLVNLKLVNDQLDRLSNDFDALLQAANLTNATLFSINQKLSTISSEISATKKAIEDGNADILLKLSDISTAIDLTNEKLDKVNENLEKMQKCNETEFNKKMCDFVDWVKQDPTEDAGTPIDIHEVEAENTNKINMSGSCPAPYELNFTVLGHAQNHSISYTPLCDALVLLKPIFVGSGALSGMFILMGYSRPTNTGVN